jgi:hypothetical protein
MRYHLFIPVLTGITGWRTNLPESYEARIWQFWASQPGANIPRLCQTAAPLVVNLGMHLQWQNDAGAYTIVPLLEWLECGGHLDDIGKGLLDGLRRTREASVGLIRGGESDSRLIE